MKAPRDFGQLAPAVVSWLEWLAIKKVFDYLYRQTCEALY
jgi:hypothetical protein